MSGSAPSTIADNLTVTDVNDNIVFTVFTLGDHRLLVDAARNPIITLRRKVCSTLFSLSISFYLFNYK